jgi:acetyl-CoA carboxylase alpha subunit
MEHQQLFSEINELKTKLAVTDHYISSFKEQDTNTYHYIDELKSRVSKLESESYNNLQDLQRDLSARIERLETKLNHISDDMASVADNSILKFTSQMDVKKWVTLIGIAFSILTSAGLIDTAINNQIDTSDEDLQNNIERLLELTE